MAKKADTKATTKVATKTVKKTASAKVTVKDLRDKSVKELGEQLQIAKADLAEARRMHVAGELVNPRVLANHKKTIARIHTLAVEKALKEANGKEDK